MIIVVDCLMCLCNCISCWILVLRSIWLADCCFCDVFGRVVYPIGVPVLSFVLLSGFFFSVFVFSLVFASFHFLKKRREEERREEERRKRKRGGMSYPTDRIIAISIS